MRSSLTRTIFRQIIRNRSLTHAQLTHQPACISTCYQQSWTPSLGPRETTRTLFWLAGGKKQKREPKEPALDPGFPEMVELHNRLRMRVRPPAPSKIVEAFSNFFEYKLKSGTPISDIQAYHALATFEHLLRIGSEKGSTALADDRVFGALNALRNASGEEALESSAKLANLLYQQLQQHNYQPGTERAEEEPHPDPKERLLFSYFRALAIAKHGRTIRSLLEVGLKEDPTCFSSLRLWVQGLKAFSHEQDTKSFTDLMEYMSRNGIKLNYKAHASIITFWCQQGNYVAVKEWYQSLEQTYGYVRNGVHVKVLNLCIANNDIEMGQPIVEKILSGKPRKFEWDIVLRWAVAKGQGIDDIERMMDVIKEECKGVTLLFDAETINGLIELAYSMKSTSLAESVVTLAARRNIDLDGTTFLVQTRYRLLAGDVHGAQEAFKQAQTYPLPHDAEVEILNNLIQALCNTGERNEKLMLEYLEDLVEKKGRFAPETVAMLTDFHIRRDEMLDAIDLLQTHAYNFGAEQRASIRQLLVKFVMDRNNATSKAWEAYSLLQKLFAETDIGKRTDLMNEFFARGRCDMGVHAFGHMRQAQLPEQRPTAHTYVQCLEGISRLPDQESLDLVHNMLKLDSEVELNTQLRNALMLAYLACQNPQRSLEFWDDIVHSREGPTYNSICIAFRACEMAPFGDKHADSIWRRLQRFEVETTPEIYSAYVGALAGQGMLKEAVEAIDNMEKAISSPPNALTIGTLHNACNDYFKQAEAVEWAKANYPSVWADLEALGMTETGRYKIDRKLWA